MWIFRRDIAGKASGECPREPCTRQLSVPGNSKKLHGARPALHTHAPAPYRPYALNAHTLNTHTLSPPITPAEA